MTIIYRDAHKAIRDANALGKTCVGWDGKQVGWVVYDPRAGAPDGVEPEFFCVRSGFLPIPLSDGGQLILDQLQGRLSCCMN